MNVDNDDTDSEELRLHIHRLLHDYSRTHYTTNYVEFTENLVTEFLEGLQPVPLTDPNSLVIEPDPYDVFSQMHKLSSLVPYDEFPETTTSEARLYLKKVMGSTLGVPKTDRVIWDDTYLPSYEPMFVALSRKSRQSTPKLGSKKQTHSPNDYRDLLKAHKIEPIQVEDIKDPPLSTDDILQLGLKIDDEDLPAVKSLLKLTSNMLREQTKYKNKYLDAFLRDESSTREYKPPESPFVPIFPKARMPRSGMAPTAAFSTGLKGFVDLPSKILAKVAVDHSDDDISMQNLKIVDGWETIRSSPPSTPSSASMESGDQIDELLLHSTPNTEPALIEELFKAQMDIPQFPRSRKIGGDGGIKPHILAGKTLGTFLQPLLMKTTMEIDQEPVVELPSSSEPSSLFGQPPSALKYPDMDEVSSHDVEDDLDVEIENLYKGKNLPNFIMDEVIDEKQNFLMEVPDLPEPNVYARKEIIFPTKFPEFLIPSDSNRGERLQHQFLKKTKGRQSLNLALSWVTFTVDKKLPTISEVVGVTDLFDDLGLENDSSIRMGVPSKADLATEMMLRSVSLTESPNPAERLRFLGEEGNDYRPPDPDDSFKLILNRNERRRVAKLEGRTNDMKASDSDGSVVADDGDSTGRVRKEGSDEFDDALPRTTKRPRLDIATDDNTDEDDSGMLSCVREIPLLLPASTDMVLDSNAYYYDVTEAGSDSNDLRHCEDQEEKENWPPFSSSFSQSIDAGSDCYRYYETQPNTEYLQEPDNDDPELPDEGSFQPLSFESRLPVTGLPSQARNGPARSGLDSNEMQQELSMDTTSDSLASRALEFRSLLELSTKPEMAVHNLGIQTFAQLRAKTISSKKETQLPISAPIFLSADQDREPRGAPADIYDAHTVCLPENITMPQSIHKYMASLDIIQKAALVRSLRLQECLVDLVERQSLDGVDLIIDIHSAVIFLSLFTLASQCAKDVERVAEQSWKFHRILVIFEAYPQSYAKKGGEATSTSNLGLYAYTPPILKAIKRFRRDLDISAACGTKCQQTEVLYAFADSVNEAALFSRLYGDFAEENDETGGVIWGDREWLDGDFLEDEEANLASVNGINRFSASIILCQVSLQEFLNIEPEDRIARFGEFIGADAVEKFNIDLESRYKAMEIMCTSE
ncbi:hypothetical protein BYT27DRAFT_7084485 [Phlegmacium glaucopus]|nr:hypothetical protein BYT27DRAFT_7084485 [Phlegmacium glaucopus]